MRIAVPVRAVAVLDDEFELDAGGDRVDPDDVDWELNEWDAYSLEAALQLAETAGDSEVVVLSVGDEEVEEPILGCLARGADRALRIWDERLAGADAIGIASVLAAAIRGHALADLVLCGVQSSDAAHGATGVALAGLLDLPRVTVVRKVELDPGGGAVTLDRELDGGAIESVRVEPPALLTVQTGANEPRYATLRAIKSARSKPLDVLGLGDLGLSPGEVENAAGSAIRGLRRPDRDARATMLTGDPPAIAARVAELVTERLER